MKEPFKSDITAIRDRARRDIEKGPLTAAYAADAGRVISVLNQALATEIVCTLRYKHHYYMASGIHGHTAAAEFLQHAADEQAHADLLAERISQLGGVPNFDPEGLATRSHTEYREVRSLREMLIEDLVAERIGVQSYSEIIRWLGDEDPTSRRLMETLLAKEEEHADDLARLLAGVTA